MPERFRVSKQWSRRSNDSKSYGIATPPPPKTKQNKETNKRNKTNENKTKQKTQQL